MEKNKILWIIGIAVIALLIFSKGGDLGLFSVVGTCEKPYTLYLSQTLFDRLGENEQVINPYSLSCVDLKRSYCLNKYKVWDSLGDYCDDPITLSCNQLFESACSGPLYELLDATTCNQMYNESVISSILDGSYTGFLSEVDFPIGNYNGTLMVIDPDNDVCSTASSDCLFTINTFCVKLWMLLTGLGVIILIVILKKK